MNEERLDDETEQRITHYEDCCYNADDAVGLPSNGVAEAHEALRQRIRILVQEARDDTIAQCEANR